MDDHAAAVGVDHQPAPVGSPVFVEALVEQKAAGIGAAGIGARLMDRAAGGDLALDAPHAFRLGEFLHADHLAAQGASVTTAHAMSPRASHIEDRRPRRGYTFTWASVPLTVR